MSHYFPKLLSFQANFGNFGVRLMKLGLFLSQFKKILKIWPMFIPVFAQNKGSSLYQEADFETQIEIEISAARPRIDLCTKNPPGGLKAVKMRSIKRFGRIKTRILPELAECSFFCTLYKSTGSLTVYGCKHADEYSTSGPTTSSFI